MLRAVKGNAWYWCELVGFQLMVNARRSAGTFLLEGYDDILTVIWRGPAIFRPSTALVFSAEWVPGGHCQKHAGNMLGNILQNVVSEQRAFRSPVDSCTH
jgi:hypothetical protein